MRFCLSTFLLASILAAAVRPKYNESGDLLRPQDYREWVWMASGLGMTYGPAAASGGSAPLFDNVFVEPGAWRSFQNTGKWPDGTMFVLEIRYSQSHGSINKGGYFQTDVTAVEMAVKDESKFPEDKWAYFDFRAVGGNAAATAKVLPKTAGCFTCHSTNGAVENTFTQFYPTAFAIAQSKGTLRPTFQQSWTPSPAGLYHIVETDGWEKGRAVLERANIDDPAAPVLQEPLLTSLGYQLVAAGRVGEAVEVFRFAAARYPRSAKVADSLAEALEAAGRRAESQTLSQRVLELLNEDSGIPEARKSSVRKAASERIARLQKH